MECVRTVDAGAYVLGALTPSEHHDFECHMVVCAECRAQTATLRDLADGLDETGVPPVHILLPPVGTAPDQAYSRVVVTIERQGWRMGWRGWVRTTAIGLLAAGLGLLAGTHLSAGTPAGAGAVRPFAESVVLEPMRALVAGTPAHAMVGYRPTSRGTDLQVRCLYLAPGAEWTFTEFVVPRTAGPERQVATWQAAPGQEVAVWAQVNLPPDQIAAIELRHDGTTLLRYRPR